MKFALLILLGVIMPIGHSAEFTVDREPSYVNQFGLTLLQKQVSDQPINTTISCLTTAYVLSILHDMAFSSAKEQIRSCLKDPDIVRALPPNLISSQSKKSFFFIPSEYSWSISSANGIFVDQSLALSGKAEEYKKQNTILDINFSNPSKALYQINKWVDNETEFKIRNFLHIDDLPEQSKVLIVTAASLKGMWKFPFDSDNTHIDQFYTSNQIIPVQMMHAKNITIPCSVDHDGCTAISLPFGIPHEHTPSETELSMVILMPDSKTTLEKFISSLTPQKLYSLIPSINREIELRFPRFHSSRKTLSLKNPLNQMGISDIFHPIKSPFKLTDDHASSKSPPVTDIFHQCFVSVNESGTEPLPKNKSVSDPAISRIATGQLPTIHINKPFLWMIYNAQMKSIIFIGSIFSPEWN